MRLTGISDTHGHLPTDLTAGDVLCICGDIVPLHFQRSTADSLRWFRDDFIPWTESVPFRRILLVGGNHDFFLEHIGNEVGHDQVMDMILPGYDPSASKLLYLCDSAVTLEGRLFWGTPWISALKRWAFYKDSESLSQSYGLIPQKCDVLLTHMPPRANGCGTVLQEGCFNSGADYGSVELADAIFGRDISYALCGHVHSGYHVPAPYGGTAHTVNVSLKDEAYEVAYEPFSFEI